MSKIVRFLRHDEKGTERVDLDTCEPFEVGRDLFYLLPDGQRWICYVSDRHYCEVDKQHVIDSHEVYKVPHLPLELTTPLACGQPPEPPQAAVSDPPLGRSKPSAKVSRPRSKAKGKPLGNDGYITFAEATRVTGLSSSQISKACTAKKVRSIGERKGRLVHAADLRKILK